MRTLLTALIFIAIANAAGLIGTFFTYDAIPTWYASLNKPTFAPPNWLFAPVWTTLYVLIGIAASLVWKERAHLAEAARGMRWWWIQLALNALWSPVFFGAKRMDIALVIIVIMWIAILMTIREFRRVNSWSALMLLPYLAWVSFASALNYAYWHLN